MASSNSEAGPSRLPAGSATTPSQVEIPSYGPEFFEYRRSLFLAGLPLPPQSPFELSETYTVPFPYPDPCPPQSSTSSTGNSVGKLEKLLREEGAEETVEAWTSGLAGVHARLDGGKKLSKPLKLGLVIKVLKAGWIQDGTWPTDPRTRRAIKAPGSPIQSATNFSMGTKATTRTAPPRPPTPIPSLTNPLPGDPPCPSLSASPRSPSFAQLHRQAKRENDEGQAERVGKKDVHKRKETINGHHG